MEDTDRSLPRHSTKGARRSRANSAVNARLSMIAEDGVMPTAPEKSRNNRMSSRGWAFNPPRHSFEDSPPKYSFWDVTGPKGEKLTDVRNNKYIARRGGWRRICLIALVILAAIVALAVGLGIGLRKKHSSSPAPTLSSGPSESTSSPFPVGSYILDTYLETISTDCTSNTTAWSCVPYHTYDESPAESNTTFNWIISPSAPGSPTNLSISSTPNPFSIKFTNASLELVHQNLQSEHYHFSIKDDKIVSPLINVNCYYGVTLEGNMYTRLKQVNSSTSNTTEVSSASPLQTQAASNGRDQLWSYAVDFTQFIGGGTDIPECYRMENGNKMERLTQGLEPKAASDVCKCAYKNNIDT